MVVHFLERFEPHAQVGERHFVNTGEVGRALLLEARFQVVGEAPARQRGRIVGVHLLRRSLDAPRLQRRRDFGRGLEPGQHIHDEKFRLLIQSRHGIRFHKNP